MGYLVIIILSAILLGWMISQCFKSFADNEHVGYKIGGLVAATLMSAILIFFCVGLREEIRYNALEDYFNGKIEVIEQIDTTRTFKFN